MTSTPTRAISPAPSKPNPKSSSPSSFGAKSSANSTSTPTSSPPSAPTTANSANTPPPPSANSSNQNSRGGFTPPSCLSPLSDSSASLRLCVRLSFLSHRLNAYVAHSLPLRLIKLLHPTPILQHLSRPRPVRRPHNP